MKNFTSPKQRAALRKLFIPPPGKIFLRLWSKNFLTEIYKNIHEFASQMPRECSSWASRDGAL